MKILYHRIAAFVEPKRLMLFCIIVDTDACAYFALKLLKKAQANALCVEKKLLI